MSEGDLKIKTGVTARKGCLVVRTTIPLDFIKNGVQSIAVEREQQVIMEGYTYAHDLQHDWTDLCKAALAYLYSAMGDKSSGADTWPWDDGFKPKNAYQDMKRAGALIAAALGP
ncbi:MAG: hypothetical protein JRI34_00810 [Deltaproteobacteria bacterium]|nr:hypothetical protein [Deltaproteobacteria bacterium]